MDPAAARLLRNLLTDRPVATLATLHRGDPAASMVPFVLPAGRTEIIIHVSGLATHTRDMVGHPRVGLLVMDDPARAASPQALPRVSLQCDARFVEREQAAYEEAKSHYLARFPDSAQTFELGDFSIVRLHPVSARLVAGFGSAFSLVGDPLESWLRSG